MATLYGHDRELRIRPERFVSEAFRAGLDETALHSEADTNDYLPDGSAMNSAEEPHADFGLMFNDGALTTASRDGGRLLISTKRVGDLALASGEVVVCDPFTLDPRRPSHALEGRVAPGEYAVFVSTVAHEHDPDVARVAGVLARFAVDEIASWRETTLGQFVHEDEGGSGYAGLFDAHLITAATREPEYFRQRLFARVRRHAGLYGDVHAPSGANGWALRAERGVNATRAFWGLDDAGRPACLVLDLDELYADDERVAAIDVPRRVGEATERPLPRGALLTLGRIGASVVCVSVDGPVDAIASLTLTDGARPVDEPTRPSWNDDGSGRSRLVLRAKGPLEGARLLVTLHIGRRPLERDRCSF